MEWSVPSRNIQDKEIGKYIYCESTNNHKMKGSFKQFLFMEYI